MSIDLPKKQEFNQDKFDKDFDAFTREVVGPVAASNPDKDSKQEQMRLFLANEIDNPKMVYPKAGTLTPDKVQGHRESAEKLLKQVEHLGEPHKSVYGDFIKNNLRQTDLVMAMANYKSVETPEDRAIAAKEFMSLNIEQYGEPDKITYQSLLSEKIGKIQSKELSPEAEEIFEELKSILPEEAFNPELAGARFRPSDETVEWAHDVVVNLYGNMIDHVPETDEMISASELRDVFQSIIDEEFGEAAESWRAELRDAKAISVSGKSKLVTVPIDRAPVSAAEARRLVVHELGIHMLTAITGESTDIAPLESGLAGYYDTQEGLGKVVEQALEGEFKEAGVDHYITAGLAYFDHKDFRGAFEAKWRMKLLEDLEPGEVPSPEQIERARLIAADGPVVATSRIFRGTDDLPWFKDLSYYNGSVEVWEYLEKIRGDDLQLSLLLAGKVSMSKEHQRVVLESKSV